MSSIVKASFVREVPKKQNSDTYHAREAYCNNERDENKALHEENISGGQGFGFGAHKPPVHVTDLQDEVHRDIFSKVNADCDALIKQATQKAKEIEDEAARLIEEAEANAAEIISTAEQKGFEIGYDKGVAEGKAEAEQNAKAGLDEIAYFIEMLNMERMQTYQEEEKELVKLSFEIAKKIMRQQIKVEKDSIPRMIEDIVKENESAVKIYLSEYNQTLFTRIDRQTREKIKELLPNMKVIVLPNDGSDEIIQIETENGMIDATVDGQITRLKEAMDL